MLKNNGYMIVGFVIFSSLIVFPAYGEVMSFQDDKPLYALGNKIHFTGTVDIGDYKKLVNLVIHDPIGKFVLISGNYSDTTYTFEITVDTNNTDQFSKKGTYQAIAFVGKESDGKILNFDFSPDGSPVIHEPPPNTGTGDGNPQLSQHYQVQLTENVGIRGNAENLTKMVTPHSSESATYDFKTILYPVISLCGVGIVVAIFYVRKKNSKIKPQEKPSAPIGIVSEPDDDYAVMVLKNRLAKGEITIEEFKTIKDALSEP